MIHKLRKWLDPYYRGVIVVSSTHSRINHKRLNQLDKLGYFVVIVSGDVEKAILMPEIVQQQVEEVYGKTH